MAVWQRLLCRVVSALGGEGEHFTYVSGDLERFDGTRGKRNCCCGGGGR